MDKCKWTQKWPDSLADDEYKYRSDCGRTFYTTRKPNGDKCPSCRKEIEVKGMSKTCVNCQYYRYCWPKELGNNEACQYFEPKEKNE